MLPDILSRSRKYLKFFASFGCFNYILDKMSQKQNLLSYFSPVTRTKNSQIGQRKRESDTQNDSDETKQANKRPKNEAETFGENNPLQKSNLSPEQKQMIESKRQQALERLNQNKIGIFSQQIGESWYDKLKPEFTKDYFIKVRC